MSATRTQVYFTRDQRDRLDALARRRGVTLAALVREAVDGYLGAGRSQHEVLAATFGVVPDLEVPSRDEWDARA